MAKKIIDDLITNQTPKSMMQAIDSNFTEIYDGLLSGGSYLTNVKDFGAKGDGVTDDTQAIVDARDSIVSTGGVLYFPTGTYLSGTLNINTTTTDDDGPRISIKGDGIHLSTFLVKTAVTDGIVMVSASATGTAAMHSYQTVSDITIARQGGGKIGAGLGMTDMAYSRLKRVMIIGFNTGLVGVDILSMQVESCFFKANIYGIIMNAGAGTYISGPNAIGFYQCVFTENERWGMYATGGATINVYGGSVEANGYWGTEPWEDKGGFKYVNGLSEGSVGLICNGVYFENNKGCCDVWIQNSVYAGAHSFTGTSFNRISNLNYVDNNIRIESAAGLPTVVSVVGCGFKAFGSYAPSATRMTVKLIGDSVRLEGVGNYFSNSVDTPIFSNSGGSITPTTITTLYSGGVSKLVATTTVLTTSVGLDINGITNCNNQLNGSNASLSGYIGVAGNSTVGGTLGVTGRTTVNGIGINGTADFGGHVNGGNMSLSGYLGVGGLLTLAGGLTQSAGVVQFASTINATNVACTGYVSSSVGLSGNAGTGGGKVVCRNGSNKLSVAWTTTLNFYVDDYLVKTFVIDHPTDPDKYLVHGTLEGPEGAVYYRGTSKLEHGVAIVSLPSYFSALTREEGVTVQLTNINGFDKLAVFSVDGKRVFDGDFTVYSDNKESSQEFDWEVKAVRADVPELVVEPDKDVSRVYGDGPYTYIR